MFLSKLQITGFKSFVEPTSFEFKNGITGIVGPNGCGKSNIVDSVRWVMGEQNPRILRGEESSDIIFGGTKNKKPLNYAEASLTFLNNKGDCPPEYINHSEIVLTRRIYRTGERDYSINKNACRLKDITNFFLSAGLGSRTYAIIAQGQIERIISAKPEEIRQMIEDTAGVTIYKARINESEKMLLGTQENLNRISDILKELEDQKNRLQDQVDKANRYKDLQNELKNSEIILIANQYNNYKKRFEKYQKKSERLFDEETEVASALGAYELKKSTIQNEIIPLESKLSNAQREVFKQEEFISSAETKREFLGKRLKDLHNRKEEDGQECVNSQKDLQNNEQEKLSLEKQINKNKKILEKINEKIDLSKTQSLSIEKQLKENQQLIEDKQDLLISKIEEISLFKNKAVDLQNKINNVDTTRISFEEQLQAKNLEIKTLTNNQNKHGKVAQELTKEQDLQDNQKLELLNTKDQVDNELISLEQQLKDIDNQHISNNSKIETLSQITIHDKDFTKELQSCTIKWSALSECLKVNKNLITQSKLNPEIIDRILFPLLDTIVVETKKDLDQLCQIATDQGYNVSLLCIENIENLIKYQNKIKSELPLGSSEDNNNNHVLPLKHFLKVTGKFKDEIEWLLSRIWVLDNLSNLNSIIELIFNSSLIITHNNQIIESSGIIHIGMNSSDNEVLKNKKQKKQIQELEIQQKHLFLQKTDLENKKAQIAEHQSEIKNSLQKINEEIDEYKVKVLTNQKDLEKTLENISRLEKEKNIIQNEFNDFLKEKNTYQNQLDNNQQRLSDAEKAKQTLETEIKREKRNIESSLKQEKDISNQFSKEKISLATLQEKINSKNNEISQLIQTTQKIKEGIQKREKDILIANNEINEVKADIDKLDQDVVKAIMLKKEHDGFLGSNNQHMELLRNKLNDLDKEFKTSIQKKEKLKDQSSKLQLEVASTNLHMKQLEENYSEKAGLPLAENYQQYTTEQFNEDKLQARIKQLNEHIEWIGPVNLLAIDDFNKIVDRIEFNQKQKEDIENTIEQLQTAIADSHEMAQTMFKKTFDQVNKHFGELFPILFSGGEARLEIDNDKEILEAGVDIIASLPGKKLQSISLFSGGEKALTAISLIFSMLKTKPTCFCILDEVDAPLDESNVVRYNKLLKELSSTFQFIVITHNKRSVEVANGLFGITMQEPGVTKVVSVELNSN